VVVRREKQRKGHTEPHFDKRSCTTHALCKMIDACIIHSLGQRMKSRGRYQAKAGKEKAHESFVP